LACGIQGYEGRDVVFRLVEIPKDERRQVDVMLPVVHRDGAIEAPVSVPEQYASEPRCRDVKACAERVATYELSRLASVEPEPMVEVEDPMAWL
jgi:hypothetical protein